MINDETINEQQAGSPDNNAVLIGVMGATGSGKTTIINLASGSDLTVGEGLESCTYDVNVALDFELDGRVVTLIDTPGFDDTNRSDTDILATIAGHLEKAYKAGMKLSGLIYVHRISDVRMGGISSRNFRMFRKLCGEDTLKNVVIVTNMWGEVGQAKGEMREAELKNKFFKPALDKGAQMLRHGNTVESAHNILRHIIQNHPLPLKIQRELVDEKKDIGETAAAQEVESQIQELIQKHQAEIKQLHEEMKEALQMKDEEAKRELEEAKRDLQSKIDDMKDDVKSMGVKYEKEKEEVDRRWQEMLRSAQREREEAERRRLAAEQQAQADRENQKRQNDNLMNQMKIDRENADRIRRERDEAEKKRVDAETQARKNFAQQQERLGDLTSQMKIDRDNADRIRESIRRERDEAERSRKAAEAQAQTDRANQQRHYDNLMNQMKTDRDRAQRERDNLMQQQRKPPAKSGWCTVQ